MTERTDLLTLDPRLSTALADRYRLERELGAGGMATVYLAQDLKHDRKVAIKVLRPELSAVIGTERFLREIKTIANLQHPHILGLIDSGEVNGTAYYVMPFVEGESLRDRLTREKQLPIAEAVRLATEIAGALDYAHRHGVIHRDIKPENILLHDGRALVADFGIALAVSSAGGSRMTETGMSLGTPHYMSPEQAMGEREITTRSDVYALGCVTYEMLVGDPPFIGSTAQAIVAKVMTERPAPPSKVRDRVPDAVEDAVLTALEKLPADRFATAAAFADALSKEGSEGGRTRSMKPSPLPAFRTSLMLGAFGAGVLLAGLAAWALRPRPRAEEVVRFAVALPQGVAPALRSVNGTTVTLSPDGQLIVLLGLGIDGVQRLYARRLDEATPRLLPGTEGGQQPFFSPDGRWVGFWADGRVQKVALAGGNPQAICEVTAPLGIAWTSGDRVVMGTVHGLFVVAAVGGTAVPLGSGDTLTAQPELFPIALAGGDRVLYASWGKAGLEGVRIGVADVGTGAKTILDLLGVAPLGVAEGRLVFARSDRNVWAIPFDSRTAHLSGSPLVVANSILTIGGRGGPKAALSASGSLVYLDATAGESQLVLAGPGQSPTPLLSPSRSLSFPRYSPDGRRISVTIGGDTRTDVWLLDLASGTPVRLSATGTVNERSEWTPDGKRVLYRSDASGRSALWWRPSDLSGPATLLLGGPRDIYFEGMLTPDQQTLVYQEDTTGSDLEYRRLAGDTTPRPIAISPADETMPRLSPDGRWIAFVTDESGATQVVVQPFPGPGGRVQVSVNGGSEPVWSRDGQRLFYRGDGKFIAASVSTAAGFAVTARTALFDDTYLSAPAPHANYDVSPDGSRLLVLRSASNNQIMVVRGWTQEMRRRLLGVAP